VSIFDQIKLADDLENAAIVTLESWWPVYTRELELQASIDTGSLPPPKSWLKADQLDRSAADALPAIVVVSPGLSGRNSPRQEGDGTFRAFFSIGIGVFVGANTRQNTMRLVRIYTAIARTIMLQKQSLGGFADGTSWLDESYDDNFPFTDDQTLSAGQVIFEVEVAGVVNRYGGPAAQDPPDPVTQPGSDWPLVESVNATVEIKED
jgi:hypothetical protein